MVVVSLNNEIENLHWKALVKELHEFDTDYVNQFVCRFQLERRAYVSPISLLCAKREIIVSPLIIAANEEVSKLLQCWMKSLNFTTNRD